MGTDYLPKTLYQFISSPVPFDSVFSSNAYINSQWYLFKVLSHLPLGKNTRKVSILLFNTVLDVLVHELGKMIKYKIQILETMKQLLLLAIGDIMYL